MPLDDDLWRLLPFMGDFNTEGLADSTCSTMALDITSERSDRPNIAQPTHDISITVHESVDTTEQSRCLDETLLEVGEYSEEQSQGEIRIGKHPKLPPDKPHTLLPHNFSSRATCTINIQLPNQPATKNLLSSALPNGLHPVPGVIELYPSGGLRNDLACDVPRALIDPGDRFLTIPTALHIQGVSLSRKTSVCGGGFSDIFHAWWGGRQVALKRQRVYQKDLDRLDIQQASLKEALIWFPLRHPNILPLLGIESEIFSPFICLVTPWMEKGTLWDFISTKELSDLDVKKLLLEAAQGLVYLHSEGKVHGDIRAVNILITDEDHACLIDFGLSDFADAGLTSATSNNYGSRRWMAPELLCPEHFGSFFRRTYASDVYAFGCLCVEVYTAQPPFLGLINDFVVMLNVVAGKRPLRPSEDTGIAMPDDMWNLVGMCLAQEPAQRPTMTAVVEIMERWFFSQE